MDLSESTVQCVIENLRIIILCVLSG